LRIWTDKNRGLEKFSKRLTALEVRMAAEGIILTEAQVIAMEWKKIS
jgi:hypothetical protein